MKSLVLYYSKTGNTKYLAEIIAKEIDAELYQFERNKEIKAESGFMLYFKGGFQSMSKRKSKIKPIKINFEEYDLILLGFPIWAWNIHPAIRGLLKEYIIKNKKFALFCSCADTGIKHLEETARMLEGNEILGKQDFVEPLTNKTEEQTNKAKEWAKEVMIKAKGK